MSKKKSKLSRKKLLIIYIIAFLFLAVLFVIKVGIKNFGLRYNETESIPKGFYFLDEGKLPKRGDYASFCLDTQLAKGAFARGYIGRGSCKNGYQPLAKRVIAIPDDIVSVDEKYITVNNNRFLYPQKRKDNLYRDIKTVRYKNKKISGYLMMGDFNKIDSWDSRYYGVILPENILGVLKPTMLKDST